MAISRIKYGGVRGKALNYSEFLCDGIEDLENLPTNIKKTDDFPTCAIGSRAFIGDNTYTLFPSQEWKPTKLVVCDCGCIHGVDSGSESEEGGGSAESTSEDLDKALSTIAAIIDGSITEIEDTKVTGTIRPIFSNCDSLTSVSFTNATSVAEHAFLECGELASVNLPSVTSIMDNAFVNCTSLTDISLPSATSIGEYAFQNCTNLKSINSPNVTIIDTYAFNGCSSIRTIKLPSATTIGQNAFAGCTALTNLYLPGAEASYTNAPFGLNTETCTIHYEYNFSTDS